MATTTESTAKRPRRFSTAIDINATPEEVWRALTDAAELVRWFPLQARVTAGARGKMFWGWDSHWAWESEIDAWEPGKRLRLVENRPAFDAAGKPLDGPSQQLAMEFTIEPREGVRFSVVVQQQLCTSNEGLRTERRLPRGLLKLREGIGERHPRSRQVAEGSDEHT